MYIDQKFTGWKRFYFPDDIELPNFTSEREVEEFINNYMTECENLYDCESDMTVYDNHGEHTLEVYNDFNDLVYKNA